MEHFEDIKCPLCGMNKRTVQKNYAELNYKIIALVEYLNRIEKILPADTSDIKRLINKALKKDD